MIKMQHDRGVVPPSLNHTHINSHGPILTIQPQSVHSTKNSKKVHSPTNFGGEHVQYQSNPQYFQQ